MLLRGDSKTVLFHGLASEDAMSAHIYSEDVIDVMVNTMCRGTGETLDRNLYRQALQGLVRLAQAEQLLAMQMDFDALTKGPPLLSRRQ